MDGSHGWTTWIALSLKTCKERQTIMLPTVRQTRFKIEKTRSINQRTVYYMPNQESNWLFRHNDWVRLCKRGKSCWVKLKEWDSSDLKELNFTNAKLQVVSITTTIALKDVKEESVIGLQKHCNIRMDQTWKVVSLKCGKGMEGRSSLHGCTLRRKRAAKYLFRCFSLSQIGDSCQ